MRVSINRGKDFSYKTVEVTGRGDASTFTAFSAAKYEQYRRGMHNFFTAAMVGTALPGADQHRTLQYTKHKFDCYCFYEIFVRAARLCLAYL